MPGLPLLFARAGVGALPNPLRNRPDQLPERALELTVTPDRDRVIAYSRVCGFDLGERLPPTYPHILAFPLQLELMTSGDFPFGAIGLVHIANRIEQHRPVGFEELHVTVRAEDLAEHPSGRSFALRTEVRAGGELVWEEVSTNLHRGRGSGERAPRRDPETSPVATWKLGGDLGRRYAAVAGDFNPIHLHMLSARPFGFARPIAHGMWTKARTLAALAPPPAFTAEVEFRRAILLPATVELAVGEEGFAVVSKAGTHLTGAIS